MPDSQTYLRHRICEGCDVMWRIEDGPDCWVCEKPGTPACGPQIGSQSGFGSAISDTAWAQVRAEIFADHP